MFLYPQRRAILTGGTLAALLLCTSAASAAPAAQPAPATKPAATQPTSEELLTAIDELGSLDPAARERASRRLWAAGPAAEPLLRAAAKGQGVDPETAARARRVLEDFASGLDPDTPDDVIRIARAYRDGAAARKPAHANELALAGVPGWRVLTRLWDRELAASTPPEQRRAIFGPLTGSMADAARLLLAPQAGGGREGDDGRAETLLEIAAALGKPADADDYVTFVVQRGRLAEAVGRWKAAPPAGKATAARVLALLLRASGDLDAARAAAADAGDEDYLLRHLAREAGDWRNAGGPTEDVAPSLGVVRLAGVALHRHRTGDAAGADEARAAVTAAAKDAAGEFTAAADAFFYTGKYDEGVTLLADLGRPVEAFKLLAARLRYADALALADRLKDKAADDEQAALVQVEAARQLVELGDRDAARARLNAATALNRTAKRHPVAVAIARAEQQFDGVRERGDGARPPRVAKGGRAERVAVAALEWADAVVQPQPEPMLSALWPAEDDAKAPVDLAGWWQYLRRVREAGQPPAPVQQSFDALRGLVERSLPPAELDELLKHVAADASQNPDPDVRAARLRLLGGTLRALGRHDEALPHLTNAAMRGQGVYAMMTLGDYLADLKRWPDAADHFGRAYEAAGGGSGEATLMWLYGWALSRTDDESDAEKGRLMMATALKLPLGDQDARVSLMTTLARHGHQPLATEQFRLINAVPLPAGPEAVWELQRGAWDAIERKQWARAALLFERSMSPGWSAPFFRDDAAQLALPAAIHRLRARGLVAAGDVPAALRAADEVLRALPGDVTLAIDLCEDLDAANQKPEADALYAKVAAARRAACDAYPNSAGHRNELAWMQAKCGRDLPEALAHAKRAVELEPDSAAYLDTLAEALFRSGNVAEAIERMKRCIELDPKSKYFRDQLRRFEGKTVEAGDGE